MVLRGLRDPALAQLVAEVSSDLSVLRGELSVGHWAPPLCISRVELVGSHLHHSFEMRVCQTFLHVFSKVGVEPWLLLT